MKKIVKLYLINNNVLIFVPDIPAIEMNMQVFNPNNLMKAAASSILSVLAALYLIGAFYSIQEPIGFAWNNHTHSSLSYYSTHHQSPLSFFSTLITESVEQIDDDVQESKTYAAQANTPFVALPVHEIPAKQVASPHLRQVVLNRPSVLLFILYHSWKSFLF